MLYWYYTHSTEVNGGGGCRFMKFSLNSNLYSKHTCCINYRPRVGSDNSHCVRLRTSEIDVQIVE